MSDQRNSGSQSILVILLGSSVTFITRVTTERGSLAELGPEQKSHKTLLTHYLQHLVAIQDYSCPSGISELDCPITKTDTAERNISIGRESLQVFFLY